MRIRDRGDAGVGACAVASADRVVVVCDNCTDATARIACADYGLDAWATVGNTHKKAGALNQRWPPSCPTCTTATWCW